MASDRTSILQHAQLLASKGNLDGALVEWKKLVQDSPNDGTLHNSIGDLHLKRNAKGEAIAAYLQAAKSFRDEGAPLKAIAAYKKILKIDPQRYDIYRYLGDLNAERGLLSSAVSDYLTLAKHYLKEKKTKEALETYRVIVAQDPSNLDAQERVAELCLQENLPEEAVRVYLQIGRERSAQGRTSEAREAYAAVLKLDPANREAEQFVNAEKQVTGGGPPRLRDGSVSDGTRGALSQPADMLGEARRRLSAGQYEGAEAMLSQLLSRDPGNPEICRLLAQLHLKQGQVNVALNEYRFLAGTALRSQDYELAESLINEFLTVEPQSVPLLELLGDLYEEKGDGATAAMHLGKAIAILQERPDPHLPALPAELYDRIKVLDPHGQIRMQLAADFEPAAASAAPSSLPTTEVGSGCNALAPEAASAETSAPSHASILSASSPTSFTKPLSLVNSSSLGISAEGPETANPTLATHAVHVPSQEPDPATRYALGIAFRNMGIYEEAIDELKVAEQQADLWLDSSVAIALCLKDLGQLASAIERLEEACRHPQTTGDKSRPIQYELALLYKASDAHEKALRVFDEIADYQDAREHIAELRAPQSAPVQ
ncbi:hypothetical protein YTPLAS18_22820 [Nitrospira sp.]|nr:hypothetical protein YTPLAS18_22820 [Nitrospira sp.]